MARKSATPSVIRPTTSQPTIALKPVQAEIPLITVDARDPRTAMIRPPLTAFPLGSTAFTGSSPAYTYRLAELRSPKLPPTGSCCVQRPSVQWSHEHWWETSHDLYFALWNLTLNQGYNIKECGKYLFQARLWYNKVYSV